MSQNETLCNNLLTGRKEFYTLDVMKGEICKLERCLKIIKDKGKICGMHRSRYWKSGGDFDYISPNWTILKRGKLQLTKSGYYRIHVEGKRVLQHRYIMEKSLKKKLSEYEIVHHLNGNKLDNRIENLKITNQSAHISEYHQKQPIINWKEITLQKRKRNRWHPNKNKVCLLSGCNNLTKYRGLCGKHYQSYWKNYIKKR